MILDRLRLERRRGHVAPQQPVTTCTEPTRTVPAKEPPARVPAPKSQILTTRVPNPDVEFVKELSVATGVSVSALLGGMIAYFAQRRFTLPLSDIFRGAKPARRKR